MWQVLLAAAVAGSTGYATKLFLTHHTNNNDPLHRNNHHDQPQQPRTVDNSDGNGDNLQDPDAVSESGFGSNSRARDGDGVFTFSSSQGGSSSRPKKNRGVSKNRVRVPKAVRGFDAEVRSGGRRLPFCLKKRKTCKNLAAKAGFCSSSKGRRLELLCCLLALFCCAMWKKKDIFSCVCKMHLKFWIFFFRLEFS